MKTLNLDTSEVLCLIVAQYNSYEVEFRLFENIGTKEKPIKGDPIDADGVWKLVICRDESAALPLKIFTNGEGITTLSNVITLSVTKAQNILPANKYYYFLRKEVDGNDSIPVFKGPFIINPFAK